MILPPTEKSISSAIWYTWLPRCMPSCSLPLEAQTDVSFGNVGPRFTPVSFFARPILRRGQAALGGVTGAALSRPV